MNTEVTYGLVLDGGGARGAYQMGAIRALHDKGIKFNAVVGTSIGALNGAIVCQEAYALGLSIWEELDYSKVFGYEAIVYDQIEALKTFDFKELDIKVFFDAVKKIIRDAGIDISPMKRLIEKHVNEDVIRESGYFYGLVTVNVSDGKAAYLSLEDMPKGSLTDYILASSYVPFFKGEFKDGKVYLDGGFYDNSPICMLLDRDYHNIVVIKLGGKLGIQRGYDEHDLNILTIAPKEDLGDLLEFDRKKIRYNLNLGYYDALRVIDDLRGHQFYLEAMPSGQAIARGLANVTREDVLTLKTLWPSNLKDVSRYTYEVALKQSGRYLGLNPDFMLEEWLDAALEYFLVKVGMKRFTVYSEEAIQTFVVDTLRHYKKTEIEEVALDVLLRKVIEPR